MAKKSNQPAGELYDTIDGFSEFLEGGAAVAMEQLIVPNAGHKALREAVAERIEGIKADVNWLADALQEAGAGVDLGPALPASGAKAAIVDDPANTKGSKAASKAASGKRGGKGRAAAKPAAPKAPAAATASARTAVPAP